MEHFSSNVRRLCGVHDLRMVELAQWTDLTASAVSKWMRGHRSVGLRSAIAVADFFEINADRLVRAPFTELLDDLSDAERFQRVEAQIARNRKRQPVVEAIRSPRQGSSQKKAETPARSQKKSAPASRKATRGA